jgi:ABC-2 type transport system ATP-binding protein
MRASEVLAVHGRLFGLGGRRLRDAIHAALERVGLDERAGSLCGELSGGMRRRLAIARALLAEPDLIVLDEPSAGLDAESREQVWAHLRAVRSSGVALLVASHDVREIERECDRAMLIREGRVVAEGPVAGLKQGLRHDSVRLEFDTLPPRLAETLESWPDVGGVALAPPVLQVNVDSAARFVPRLFESGIQGVRALRIREATLEDVYFRLSGAELEDDEWRQ